MKNVLIVEKQIESLKLNESVNNSSKILLSGNFTEFDIENRNKRFYNAANFLPIMNNLLEKKKMLGVIYGEFDHPDVFDIAGKNASHAIESLVHNEESNRIDGTIALLSTHWGKEAKAIINDGYPLFVSSRAAGVTDANGGVMLKELFTYDIVLDPGFATSNVSVNESFGLKTNEDTHYRIYEMKDGDVNNLHIDNKNDNKTEMDLKYMKKLLATEMAKLEYQLTEKIKTGKFNPTDILAISEKYDLVNDELVAVKLYLETFKTKINYLVKENKNLKTANTTLVTELNESVLYSNHLASVFKKLNEQSIEIESRLSIDEKMIEYVAEHAKANILMTEDLSTNVFKMNEDLSNNSDFLQYVAKETEITQMFAEQFAKDVESEIKVTQDFLDNTAKETEIAQKFAESTAKETEIAQKFIEYVANESYKDQVFLDYISEKLDGVVGYSKNLVNTLKVNTPILENVNTDIETIHNLSDIEEYLGVIEEKDIINNVTEEIMNDEETEEEIMDATEEEIMDATEEEIMDATEEEEMDQTEELLDTDELSTVVDTVDMENIIPIPVPNDNVIDTTALTDINLSDDTIEAESPVTLDGTIDTSMETSLLSSLVKILDSDDTGIIIEITPDNKVIIQKSGTDETVELEHDKYEVMNVEENLTETVNDVLAEIKRQKILANQQPHFMSFLSEQQIADFKSFSKDKQDAVVVALDESEYYNTSDVLNIIGKTLNDTKVSYEDKLISNVPENIKEAWNSLDQNQKVSVITESKYFSLSTSADMKNFWATRPFAKSVTGSNATMIKESFNSEDSTVLSDEYINAFLTNFNNLNTK